jgi:hypothetical protein
LVVVIVVVIVIVSHVRADNTEPSPGVGAVQSDLGFIVNGMFDIFRDVAEKST